MPKMSNFSNYQLGVVIRKYRKNMNLTQKQLAQKIDIHHNQLGAIERGETGISFRLACHLIKILKFNLEDLKHLFNIK